MSQSEKNLTAVFTDTANAIRAKKQSVEQISPLDFADEVASIETGITPTGTKTITTNGTHDVTNYASANVNVPSVQPSGKKDIRYNGIEDVTAYSEANVFVLPILDGGGLNYLQSYLYNAENSTPMLTNDAPGVELDYINYQADPWISITTSCNWAEHSSKPVDAFIIPGGTKAGNHPQLMIGAIHSTSVPFNHVKVYLYITYYNYSGEQTEEAREALESEWSEYLHGESIIYMDGIEYAKIQIYEVSVSFEGGC